ncbi:hypothetical protein [Pantoea sp. Cy-639]|uniref:hypothetical protein n=1 Tax=Pantoea sp. Cy-639 TaxID=2608360 RepID=UPI0014209C94|nr:hypothetical protein [Pantoea sp. Cy-639]NIF15537.1 hypothetical protein [Pantoea sp. Cy-639]
MVGISNLNINVASGLAATAPSGEKAETGVAALHVDMSGLNEAAKKTEDAKKAQSGDQESSEPSHIQQMRQMIKQLQKQLAEEQKQLAQIASQKMDDTAKLALITAKQASIATLSGQIQAATAQLLEALSKTGGSSAGGMVSTQA